MTGNDFYTTGMRYRVYYKTKSVNRNPSPSCRPHTLYSPRSHSYWHSSPCSWWISRSDPSCLVLTDQTTRQGHVLPRQH